MRHLFIRLLPASLVLLPTAALAHTGVGVAHGFSHGALHPLTGLDHILAMATVGVFAWQLGGRALWLLPATFLAVMAGAGALGMLHIAVPFVETGIALSVAALGAIIALQLRTPVVIAMGLVGLVAIVHGHAHGTEMPRDASGLSYAAGFMTATAGLHATGIALGTLIGRAGSTEGRVIDGRMLYRVTGALVAVAGLGLLGGAI